MPILCPICGKDDTVNKVSAIVMGGKYSGGASTVAVGASAGDGLSAQVGGAKLQFSSRLAQILSPPPFPQSNGWFSIGCGSALMLPILMFLKYLEVFEEGSHGSGTLIVFIGVWCAVTYFLYSRSKTVFLERRKKWESSAKRWERLYYCSRDDVLIDSKSGKTSSPYELQSNWYL
jgi:hypothetical protein